MKKNYIDFKKVYCKDCFRCLRKCPVKSIRFLNHQAEVIEDDCILCGNCYLTCPQGAKRIRSDVSVVEALLKTQNKVFASVAPSFIANYPNVGFENMTKALKSLGFSDAFETAIGATIVKDEYEKLIEDGKQNIIISSCCPTVNMLITKYYPDVTKYLASVLTPAQAHAKLIKATYPNSSVVFIGPCLSKKEEVDENPNLLDAAITFSELSEWFEEKGIQLDTTENVAVTGKTRLFPTSGGILKSMNCTNENYQYLSIDGLDNCKHVLEELGNNYSGKCFIEMSACSGSCIGGPGMDKSKKNYLNNYVLVHKSSGPIDFSYNGTNITKIFASDSKIAIPPSDAIIDVILAKIGKTKKEDELNCGSCGYNTCRDKAIALYYGKTEPSMCLPYLKSKAESFRDDIVDNTPNAIFVLNENLDFELINKSACSLLHIDKQSDVIGKPVMRVLDPTPYAKVSMTKSNSAKTERYFAEYDTYVEETIIYDAKYNIVIAIMRDITKEINEHNQKEKISANTIEITDKVIEKQMRAVQEIAMLLGETTAETKVALQKLKESLNDK